MDISELQLKINKKQAVNDLKSVESQLEKTGNAADGLISTLKDIGLTVGFGKLVKDSLQLNNTFKALDGKFKSIFSGGFDTKVFSELKSELTLSDSALKNILSTTGQFAKGLGQSSQYVKNFSTDLTKAAADYAAYQGKTSAADVNEYARKFAKATLGEVGELKDIGIIIDTTSASFKNAVKEMAELTGTTEAQARQMVIQKELIEQVKIASGAASKNMFDGWAQLNKLFDQFKEILGDVGKIFSTAFGPALKILNGILEIPLVKSATAWSVAIGGVVVGYVSLISSLKKISGLLATNNAYREIELKSYREVLEVQDKILKRLKQRMTLQKNISKLESGGYRSGFFSPSILKNYQNKNEANISKLTNQLKGLNPEVIKMLPGLEGIKTEFIDFMMTIPEFSSILDLSAKKTLLMVAAEKALAAVRATKTGVETAGKAISTGVDAITTGAIWTAIGVSLKKNFAKLGEWLTKAAGALWTGTKAVFSVGWKAIVWIGKFIVVPLAKVLGLILSVVAAFVVPFDLTIKLMSKLLNQDFSKFELIPKIANLFVSSPDMAKIDKDLKNKLEISKKNKQIFEELYKNAIKPLTDTSSLKGLKQAEIEAQKNLKETKDKMESMRRQFTINANITDDKERGENLKKLQEEFKQLADTYKQHQQSLADVQDKIKQKQKELIEINWKFFDELDKLNDVFDRLKESFSMGYKNGKFQDLSKDYKYQNDAFRLGDLNRHLNKLGGETDVTSLERSKKYLTEIFNLTKDRFRYEVDQLLAQRTAMINNLKAMSDIVKQAAGFRSSAQASVEASSMDALRLTSRRMEGLSGRELSPMVEQQKQVKEIERQVLVKQNQAVTTLEKINNQLYNVVNKIGTGSGANAQAINAVNPL